MDKHSNWGQDRVVLRIRLAVIVLYVLLHVATGAASALGACCEDAHSAASKVPLGKMDATCGAGHDNGVPVAGFGFVPRDPESIVLPEQTRRTFERHADTALLRGVHPPTPPPRG